MGDQGFEVPAKEAVHKVADLVVQPDVLRQHSVIALTTILFLRPHRSLLHQAMQKGFDGGVAPRLARFDLIRQSGGRQRPATPKGREDNAFRLGDSDAGQDRNTARSMRASTTQLQITATTPAIRPSMKMKTASATPGARTG